MRRKHASCGGASYVHISAPYYAPLTSIWGHWASAELHPSAINASNFRTSCYVYHLGYFGSFGLVRDEHAVIG